MSPRRTLGLLCWACILASSLFILSVAPVNAQTNYKVIRRIPVTGEGLGLPQSGP